MTDRPAVSNAAEFTEIFRQFLRLKSHLTSLTPEDMIQARARFQKLMPEDRTGDALDYDLLYRIGSILSHRQQPMTMGELSQALDVPLSTATRIVDLLVKNDYAGRVPDADDRRIVRVRLTETGQGMYHALDEFIRMRVDILLRHFTAGEQENLIVLLRKVVMILDKGDEAP
jgi:DNA-binding MarR family transcriptional regulator